MRMKSGLYLITSRVDEHSIRVVRDMINLVRDQGVLETDIVCVCTVILHRGAAAVTTTTTTVSHSDHHPSPTILFTPSPPPPSSPSQLGQPEATPSRPLRQVLPSTKTDTKLSFYIYIYTHTHTVFMIIPTHLHIFI